MKAQTQPTKTCVTLPRQFQEVNLWQLVPTLVEKKDFRQIR